MEEYGKVKRVRVKLDRKRLPTTKRAIICFSNEKEAATTIKDTNK